METSGGDFAGEPDELFNVTINYEGNDYAVWCDGASATRFINDPIYAQNHVEKQLKMLKNANSSKPKILCSSEPDEDEENRLLEQQQEFLSRESQLLEVNGELAAAADVFEPDELEQDLVESGSKGEVWTKRKPDSTDMDAAQELIDWRQKLSHKFDDKKTHKETLWSSIAKNLKEKYNLGSKPTEKLKQKWKNLVKSYYKEINRQKTTGEGTRSDDEDHPKVLPLFFDEIHSILGCKHKTKPALLVDSMEEKENPNIEETNKRKNSDPDPTPDDRFKKKAKTCTSKPNNKKMEIAKELQEDRKQRQEQFEFFKKHLEKSEEQKDKFLMLLEKMSEKK